VVIASAALLFRADFLHGQELSHPLAAAHGARPQKIPAVGTYNVLAIMVQFQTDRDTLTSGNGELVISQGSGIDSPPHDKTYFENHLLFLKNYFNKVSGGKDSINYTVLDSVVTLPHQIKYYSPPKSGNGNNLGLLFRDSWHTADSLYHGTFPFSQYQCFVIFHAGSGHDIDFTATIGYDPLPYDIPSIYLDLTSLAQMFGAGYGGQSVDGGSFHVNNSIIMPEWEDFPIDSLRLGINGLLAASFGSFLGLPDLFDTQTGVTGIGRFGLMDGQGFFSYGGIFPPEPSVWEKAYLGWITPTEVSPSKATQYQLYANATGKYSALKIPISSTEYFLLENREGDANHDGENVTSYYDGSYSTMKITFATASGYFDGVQIKNINGVVTDADEYDWALPQDTTYFGGILVWHIDQTVIDQNLSTNTVNANPAHRGVAVMEAHGANEIGRYIQTIFGGNYYDGSFADFWYNGNPARHANPYSSDDPLADWFTPFSLPNSDGYNEANSHIYVTNFSSHDSLMTFYVTVDSIASNFTATSGFPKNIHGATENSSPTFGHISPDGKLQVIANNGDSLYTFNMDGSSAGFDSTGFFSKVGGKFQPIISGSSVNDTLYAMDDSVFYGLVDHDNDHDGTADMIFATKDSLPLYEAGLPLLALGAKVISVEPDDYSVTVFSSKGKYLGSRAYPPPVKNSVDEPLNVSSAVSSLSQCAAIDTSNVVLNFGGRIVSANLDNISSQSSSVYVSASPIGGAVPQVPIGISFANLFQKNSSYLVWLTLNSVYIDSLSGNSQKIFTSFPGDTIISGPVVADLDGDGNRDIIFATQTKVYTISYTGAVLNHFPISTVGSEVLPPDANRIVGSIVVAALTGDTADVIFGTKGGTIYAFNGVTGQLVTGFPVNIGDGLAGSPALAYDSQSGNLYLDAIGLDGYLYSWTFKGNYLANSILWANLLRDNNHANSITEAPAPRTIPPSITDTLSLMPKVYNWPNPVTNGATKIRFYLNHDAQVSISVYSFAGSKVADIPTANGTGGTYGEVDWNVAGVQSGVYFARVEAISSKVHEVKIIKIAVVK